MLSSLPPMRTHGAHDLWYHSNSVTVVQPQSSEPSHVQRNASRGTTTPPQNTAHGTLRADENAILTRKANIRRFGAGWIRPPGVGKTLQGIWDEKAEREEAEAAAMREQLLANEQAAAEAAEAAEQGRADPGMLVGDDSTGEDERDLDDDIPDADADDSADDNQEWIDDDGDDALPTEEGDGDYVEGTVGGMRMAPGEEEMMGARDLDEDVPEAGSYQHTDTDAEDDSSDDEAAEIYERDAVPGRPGMGNAGLGSSVFGSSPAIDARATRASGSYGARRSRGMEN